MGYTFSFEYEYRTTGWLKNGAGKFKTVPRHEELWGDQMYSSWRVLSFTLQPLYPLDSTGGTFNPSGRSGKERSDATRK